MTFCDVDACENEENKTEGAEEWLSTAENLLVASPLLDNQDLPEEDDDVNDTKFDLLAIHYILQATHGPKREWSSKKTSICHEANASLLHGCDHTEQSSDVIDKTDQIF